MRFKCPRGGRRYGVLATVVLFAMCGGGADSLPAQSKLLDKNKQAFPAAPAAGTGALAPPVREALASVAPSLRQRRFPSDAVSTIGMSGDGRLLWYLYDLMRFATRDSLPIVVDAFEELSGAELPGQPITAMGDRVLAWDLPAPPDYRLLKGDLFLQIEPRWAPFFEDEDSAIDWRLVGWGGVYIDDRADATAGQICPRGCIPALDQPAVTDAKGGSWYPDNDLVFGIVIGRQARAYPKNIMEVHEMVNDTLGGRRLAIPYCTLCLSVQAYFTDDVKGFRPLLRTSGLLSRSNKFMYDVTTFSAVDTFTGEAISGSLLDAGVKLNQTTVVTSHLGGVARGPPGHHDHRGRWRNRPELPAQPPARPRRRRPHLSRRRRRPAARRARCGAGRHGRRWYAGRVPGGVGSPGTGGRRNSCARRGGAATGCRGATRVHRRCGDSGAMKHSGLRGVSFSQKRSCGSGRARGRAPLRQRPERADDLLSCRRRPQAVLGQHGPPGRTGEQRGKPCGGGRGAGAVPE